MTDGKNVRSPQSTAKTETKKIKAMINVGLVVSLSFDFAPFDFAQGG